MTLIELDHLINQPKLEKVDDETECQFKGTAIFTVTKITSYAFFSFTNQFVGYVDMFCFIIGLARRFYLRQLVSNFSWSYTEYLSGQTWYETEAVGEPAMADIVKGQTIQVTLFGIWLNIGFPHERGFGISESF